MKEKLRSDLYKSSENINSIENYSETKMQEEIKYLYPILRRTVNYSYTVKNLGHIENSIYNFVGSSQELFIKNRGLLQELIMNEIREIDFLAERS